MASLHLNPRAPHEPVSSLLTIVALAVVAYAAADTLHEMLGHALVAKLVGVKALSISSVALQTAETSRVVAAAGTLVNLVTGAVAFAWLSDDPPFDAGHYCVWLFAFVSSMNSGYLVASGVLDSGDWAVVIDGLSPQWAWRSGVAVAGVMLYKIAVRAATRTAIAWVTTGAVSVREIRCVMVWSYIAGGVLLVLASALNPIGPALILASGVGASFGLTWGLLIVPGIVASRTVEPPLTRNVLRLPPVWAALALLVGILFVGVLGPGIRLSR
jgi:hypothetical protein